MDGKDKLGKKSEHQQRKKENMQTKSIFALCATYNEEFGLMAISLIDKEIKVYRVKKNGNKISFIDLFSF